MRTVLTFLMLSSFVIVQVGGKAGMGGKAGVGAGVASSSPSVVQFNSSFGTYGSNPSITAAYTSNVVSGNILVVAAGGGTYTAWNLPTGSGTGCSSTTFTAQGSPSLSSPGMSAWTGTASGSGACTITASATSSGATSLGAIVYEIMGGTTSGIVISTYGVTSGCTSCSGNTLTTVSTNNLVLTFLFNGGGNAPLTAPSPFSFDINANDVLYSGGGHYAQAAAGLYSPTWTSGTSANFENVALAIP